MSTLSVLYIIRNEEDLIERSLNSVKEIADEIIIVDTGSCDRTLQVCRTFRYTKILSYDWVHDYSKTKNYGINQCTKEWVLSIDGDEMLDKASASAIKAAISSAKPKVCAFGVHIVDHEEEWGPLAQQNDTPFFQSPQTRIFRRSQDVRFEGRVLESVDESIRRKGGATDVLSANVHHFLWRGKKESYKVLKLRYYNKLGANFPKSKTLGTSAEVPKKPEPVEKVGICILAFNSLNATKKCIESISRHTNMPYQLFLIDNGSTDGTSNYMREATGRVPMRNARNVGVAKGKNTAAQEMLKNPQINYMCFLDNDTVVHDGWLEEMMSTMKEKPNCAIVGPVSCGTSGVQNVSHQYHKKTPVETAKLAKGRNPRSHQVKEIDGFCMLVRTSALGKIGLFDDSFGMYGYEDKDFCRRMKEAGYDIYVANRVFVEHHGGASVKASRMDWARIMSSAGERYGRKWDEKQPIPVAPNSIGSSGGLEKKFSRGFAHPLVSIVLLTHNRLDVTRQCVQSIADNTSNYELIVVDNGSTDGTPEFVSNVPKANLIRNKKNAGIPKARNQGIREAKGNYLIVMDNDVIVKNGWVQELFCDIQNGADIVGIEAWKIDKNFAASMRCNTEHQGFSYLSGACCMFRRSVFEKIGLLDEGFSPAYYEDSIVGDRLIPVRYAGQVDVVPIEALFEMGVRVERTDGKEESYLPCMETLAVDPDNPCPELAIDSLPEWWLRRNLSDKERDCYAYRNENECSWAEAERHTRLTSGYVCTRIKKRIERSQREDALPQWRPIVKIIRHKPKANTVRLTSKYGHTVCTPDHSVMSWEKNKLVPTTEFKKANLCQANLGVHTPTDSFLTIDMSAPTEDNWYLFPNHKGQDYAFPHKLDYEAQKGIAEALFFYLGVYAAEGSISGTHAMISMSCKSDVQKVAAATEKFVRRGITVKQYSNNCSRTRVIRGNSFKSRSEYYFRCIVGNKTISEWIGKQCGNGCRNKKIPTFVFTAPACLKKIFLEGLFAGDAHLFSASKSKHAAAYSDEYKNNAFKFGTTSLRLSSGLCLLLSSVEERYSVGYDDEKGEYKVNYLHYRKNCNTLPPQVRTTSSTEFVYDMAVDDLNTFVDACGMLVLHNTDICVRATAAGLKLKWRPTRKIKHREHCTLIHGQKDFNYQEQIGKSYMRFAQKMRGEIKVEHELLPARNNKLKILYLGMQWDYGIKDRGLSFEHDNFYPSLTDWENTDELVHFDYVDLGQKVGISKMSGMLLEAVYKYEPDALFAVFFNEQHDPQRAVLKRISESTPTTTIGWFCDSHWRYQNFDRPWSDNLNFCVTTSTEGLRKYERDALSNKVIKSQWAASPKYKRTPDLKTDVDVSFVGQPHGDRRQVISQIQRAGIMVSFYGTGWGQRLSFDEMVRMFNRSKINLNLNNSCDAQFKQIKGRNFEVPACGGFLLTGRAENLDDYYEYGKEVETFDSTGEMIDKIKYYLCHEDERRKIADAAYRRTLKDHTYAHRFNDIFKKAGLL